MKDQTDDPSALIASSWTMVERLKAEGYVTASEMARILGRSPRTVRGWLSEGIIPGVLVDEGPGKKTWYVRPADVYASTDPRVTKFFNNARVAEHRTADQILRDYEQQVVALEACLREAEEKANLERRDYQKEMSELQERLEQEINELTEEYDLCRDTALALGETLHYAVTHLTDIEEFIEGSGIKIKHETIEKGQGFKVSYIVKRNQKRYCTQDFTCSTNRSTGLSRLLLCREAGSFFGCRKPSAAKLQARKTLYTPLLTGVVVIPIILGFILMCKSNLFWLGFSLFVVCVLWVVVVDLYYRTRIFIRGPSDKNAAGDRAGY